MSRLLHPWRESDQATRAVSAPAAIAGFRLYGLPELMVKAVPGAPPVSTKFPTTAAWGSSWLGCCSHTTSHRLPTGATFGWTEYEPPTAIGDEASTAPS